MGPRRSRPGVSTFLATFILVATVLALSAVVYSSTQKLAVSSQPGAQVSIPYASIKQASGVSIETLTVASTGTQTITQFNVQLSGISSSATFYLTLTNPTTGAALSSSCGAGTNPASVPVCVSLPPGQAAQVTISTRANLFTVGTSYAILITTTPPASATYSVVASSA